MFGPMQSKFLDMQAEVGISKHIGGLRATRDLLSMCHVDDAREVLEVGCGIGVGPAYIARTYGCRVVGVDISERMIEWSRQRAREEGVEDRVEFEVADVRSLPFQADRFDAVFCESVLAFVTDKEQAIRELVRVTRPGGYVGLNEGLWRGEPPEDVARVARDMGIAEIPTAERWRALWERSGLEDRVITLRRVDPNAEVRSRLRWIGLSWAVRTWGRALRLYITNPEIRRSFQVVASGGNALDYTGYGLFAGRKPG
jgi:SAM-dependent methyltransferase